MGITINHRLAQQQGFIKDTLDHAERVARAIKAEQADKLGIAFEVRRLAETELFIDIGGCETLAFDFKPFSFWKNEHISKGFSYAGSTLEDYEFYQRQHEGEHYERYPEQKLLWASDFCKTQYAGSLVEHKWVADLIREVAGMCVFAVVDDEADYYHNRRIDDAGEAIESLGKMITGLGKQLAENFQGDNITIQKGGDTKIKSRKHK